LLIQLDKKIEIADCLLAKIYQKEII